MFYCIAFVTEYIQGEENFQLKLTANAKVAQEEQRRLERAIQQIGVENSQIQRKIQKYTDDKDKVVELTEIDREKIKVREASINQKENRLDRQTRVEEKMIENYQKVLGLSIVPCEDQSLQFTFKFIDKRQPKAEYHVVIETSDSRTFEGNVFVIRLIFAVSFIETHILTGKKTHQPKTASHCEPMIPEVEYLRTALKEERIDLPKFIRDVRAAFVRHAEAEAKHRKRT